MYHGFPKIKIYSHNIVSIYTENLKRVMQKKMAETGLLCSSIFIFRCGKKNRQKTGSGWDIKILSSNTISHFGNSCDPT